MELKHGELYSRKGACPNRTSGPFNGRPRHGIRSPLLGLRRVLQDRHANISSGRPKWKTQTRNIEISSERRREGGGQSKKRGKAQSLIMGTHTHTEKNAEKHGVLIRTNMFICSPDVP